MPDLVQAALLVALSILAVAGVHFSHKLIERAIFNVGRKRARKARSKRKYVGHYTTYKKRVQQLFESKKCVLYFFENR